MSARDPLDRISIKDVAKAAGTSVSTVSRALNDHPDVSQETREHVISVARNLGYERNPFAQSLISGKSGLVAIVVHEIDNDYHLQLIRGLSRAARQLDQEILFTFTESRVETLKSCTSVYRRGVADGAVVFSPAPQDQLGLLKLQNAGFPLVIIQAAQTLKGLTSISPMDFQGAVDATQHFIDLGHRRIGLITESREWGAGPGRLSGYRAAMEANHIPLPEDLILERYSGYPSWGHKAARHYIDKGLDLTAVLCFNDLVAYGLIQEFTQAGVKVPERISVIGFDDIPNSRYTPACGLTTVRQPIVEIGETALEMIVDLINQRIQPGAHLRIPMELVIRGTTAPAPHPASTPDSATIAPAQPIDFGVDHDPGSTQL